MKPPTPSASSAPRLRYSTYPVIDLNSRSLARLVLTSADTMLPCRDESARVSRRIRRSDSRCGAPDWKT